MICGGHFQVTRAVLDRHWLSFDVIDRHWLPRCGDDTRTGPIEGGRRRTADQKENIVSWKRIEDSQLSRGSEPPDQVLGERRESHDKETRNAGKRPLAVEPEALTDQIMGAAIEVHRCLRPGFLDRSVPAFLPSLFTLRGA
jgi:hypothetical protein